MNAEELKIVLKKHSKWLNNEEGGECANLSRADLSGADLSEANLSRADLSEANLSRADLSGADLRGADLHGADLHGADLRGANLRGASLSRANLSEAGLRGADLHGADLHGANLCGADLDYSSGLPMSCSGLRVNIDDRVAVQLLYHCLNNVMHSNNISLEFKKALLTAENCRIANKFHRVKECGKIEVYDEKV